MRSPLSAVAPVLVLGLAATPASTGTPDSVVHPNLFNAVTNEVGVDEQPGLATNFSASSAQAGADTIEDAFGNQDGAIEPGTFIFGDGGVPDNGNQTLGDAGETVDFLDWETTEPVEILGYQLLLTQADAFGRTTQLVRFLVDGVEEDFFDNDGATGPSNAETLVVPRPLAGPVTGSTFRLELTRTTNGPRITEIDALTESFCGNGTVEADEQCDDGNTVTGDGCEADCTPVPEPAAPLALALGAAILGARRQLSTRHSSGGSGR
jgi:cysteine-rich repeat protein